MLNSSLVDFFYLVKPIIPRRIQLSLRRRLIFNKLERCSAIWPINQESARPPTNWSGWPRGKRFALVLTHDIDTQRGYDNTLKLMEIEKKKGFVSSYNIVPERYRISSELRNALRNNGFEVGVHDLNHDGKLFKSEKIFRKRVKKINEYLKDWECLGFRAGAMHCNLEWIHSLNIDYDMSTFDTDPFEAKPVNRNTIFPFLVYKKDKDKFYVELPYTIPQDFTIFVLMKNKNIDIWTKKLDWVVDNGGMALLTTHPDYMNFNGKTLGLEEYPVKLYEDFLEYIKSRYEGQYWHVLPADMANYCKENRKNISRIIVN